MLMGRFSFKSPSKRQLKKDEAIFNKITFDSIDTVRFGDIEEVNLEKVANDSLPEEYRGPDTKVLNQGSIGSCHDTETQVLTRSGWKYFKDITKEDLLASVDPETNTIIFEHPTDIISYKYTGDMIVGKHMSLDFKVTPNHKMLVRPWNESIRKLDSKYVLVDADKIGYYCGLMSTFNYNGKEPVSDDECIILKKEKIANGNILPEQYINLHDWVQFVGIYLAEGTLCTDPIRYHYRIQIAAVKDREVKYVSDLLKRLNIKSCEHHKDRFYFCNKRIWQLLESYGLHGVYAKDKFVPDFIFDLDSSYIKDFLLGFGMGDGHQCLDNKWQYFTSSPKMAEQLQILSLLAGKWNKITTRPPRPTKFRDHIVPIENVLPNYTISERVKPLSITRKQNISTEFYDDFVYCATMPTYHTLITKRNENILVSGNCCAHACATAFAQCEQEITGHHKRYSPGYIYGNRSATDHQGEGYPILQAITHLENDGVPLWEDFTYNLTYPKVKALIEKDAEHLAALAEDYKVESHKTYTTINEIKQAVMKYGGVIINVPVYTDFSRDLEITKTNVLKGWHAMVIVGWNKDDQWIVQNSWGPAWGYCGRLLMRMNYPIRQAFSINICSDSYMGYTNGFFKKVWAHIKSFFVNLFP